MCSYCTLSQCVLIYSQLLNCQNDISELPFICITDFWAPTSFLWNCPHFCYRCLQRRSWEANGEWLVFNARKQIEKRHITWPVVGPLPFRCFSFGYLRRLKAANPGIDTANPLLHRKEWINTDGQFTQWVKTRCGKLLLGPCISEFALQNGLTWDLNLGLP